MLVPSFEETNSLVKSLVLGKGLLGIRRIRTNCKSMSRSTVQSRRKRLSNLCEDRVGLRLSRLGEDVVVG